MKIAVAVLIIAFVAAAGYLIMIGHTRRNYTYAIVDVFQQQEAAQKTDGNKPLLSDYDTDLAKIDTSKCPEAFRLAWTDFIRSVDAASLHAPTTNQLADIQAKLGTCEDQATQYGITFKQSR